MNEKFFTLSPEKQARITNAALEVFARNDYKHASTDDIAAKAGISKGLLFYYFRNKQSLYLYLYDYALEQVRGQVLRQKLDGVTDFFELMHIGARAKLELLTRCPYLLEFSIRLLLPGRGYFRRSTGQAERGPHRQLRAVFFQHRFFQIPSRCGPCPASAHADLDDRGLHERKAARRRAAAA